MENWVFVHFEKKTVKVKVDHAQEVLKSANQRMQVDDAQGTLREMSGVFGLRLGAGLEARVEQGWGEHLRRFG